MPIIGLLVGAVVGLWLGHNFDALLGGAFVGLIAGLLLNAWQKRSAQPAPSAADVNATRLVVLEERLARVEAALERAGLTRPTQPVAPPAASIPPSAPSADIAAEHAPMPQTPPISTDVAPTTSIAAASTVPPAPAYGASAPGQPNRIWGWITGGNTLARVGIIVLFIGVGFLLKYAAEHVTVPIELRVAGVALGGVALLVLGWRLRERRTAYAMILQGGGVGVLYLTVFSALKLYALLPPGAAFALLFVIAALSSWLAVRQDAIALAAVGVVGGFFAPILTSSGSGNHVVLFSYYALLNAGIFFVAWFKAWRLLNLLGFACTFIIGTLWGVTRYRPADFATTEPFLIVFFLFYVSIAVLYALKRSVEVKHYVDGTIVFGTPLVAAGVATGAGPPIRVWHGRKCSGRVCALSRARPILMGPPARRFAFARRIVSCARRRFCDARRAAGVRCSLDVGNVGARRRSHRMGRRSPGSFGRACLRSFVADCSRRCLRHGIDGAVRSHDVERSTGIEQRIRRRSADCCRRFAIGVGHRQKCGAAAALGKRDCAHRIRMGRHLVARRWRA